MQLKTHVQLENVDLDEENIGYEYPTKANYHMFFSGIFICVTFFLGIMVGFALLKKVDKDLEKRISELERYNGNLSCFQFFKLICIINAYIDLYRYQEYVHW